MFQGEGVQAMVQGLEPIAYAPNGDPLWAVERILGHRRRADGTREYRVKWENWTEPTWEEAESVEHLPSWNEYNERRFGP